MKQLRTAIASMSVLASLCAPTLCAQAQEKFPSRPLQVIVPSPPGGGTDITARMIASLAQPILGQQVLVLNKPGAGGAVGMSAMLQAKPDGYTVAGVWNAPITITPSMVDVTYTRESYVPLELSDVAPTVYCASKDFPANNAQELMALLKANPNKYTYGTDGVTGNVRLGAELIFSHFGVHARPIPYNGSTETLNAFTGHYIDMYGGATAPILPFVKNGSAKCLMVSSEKQSPLLPGAASAGDLGVPEDATYLWHAMIASAAVPKDRLAILEHAFQQAAASQKFKDFAATQGEDAPALGSADARKLINREYDQFAGVIKTLGLKDEGAKK